MSQNRLTAALSSGSESSHETTNKSPGFTVVHGAGSVSETRGTAFAIVVTSAAGTFSSLYPTQSVAML